MCVANMLGQRKQFGLILSLVSLITAVNCLTAGFHSLLHAHTAIGGIPPGLSEEYFAGGRSGTVFNTTSQCLELPSPAITADPKLLLQFQAGEVIFEADFVTDPKAPFGGLGPVYNNTSCKNCHPNYGRGRRVDKFSAQFGNGYLAIVHTPDGKVVPGFTLMLQTMANPPFVPPAKGVTITWNHFVDKYGNKYPDGTPYNQGKPTEGTLVYPSADLIEPVLPLPEGYMVSIEGTIGIFGTGLLDAIPGKDIIAEAERQKTLPGSIKGQPGKWIEEPYDGRKHLGRFTPHNSRATLQNGPGFNGIWSVSNITRADRPKLYATQQWIDKQAELGLDISSLTAPQPIEMTQEQLDSLVVWSQGLAVPAARNLDNPTVKWGKELFKGIGCMECHKASWVTGDYPCIPGYARQKIWPYTDLLMHDMGPENRGLSRNFRTPPLWARGLMKNAADHTDMWHDLRARDFEEAILWHFGESIETREAFRNLSAKERTALVEFLKSI